MIFPKKRELAHSLLIVHIPKTAGTSLRLELERVMSRGDIYLDYGECSARTSPLVRKSVYVHPNLARMKQSIATISEQRSIILTGHFPVSKYGHLFSPEYSIAFVRDPLVRCASEYLHFQRERGIDATFQQFFERPDIVNRQVGYLNPFDAKMFVGVTEEYEKSIAILSERYSLDLHSEKKNVSPSVGGQEFVASLPRKTIERFRQLNRSDIDFYRERLDVIKGL